MYNIVEYKNVEIRQFRRINRYTGKEDRVQISNRNGFDVDTQLKMLNLNDKDYIYKMLGSKAPHLSIDS